jgi:hypothetical protein
VREEKMAPDGHGDKSPTQIRAQNETKDAGWCTLGATEKKYRITNIGLGGIRLFSSLKFEPGDKYTLKISLHSDFFLEARAYVVWCLENTAGQEGDFEVGLKFIDLTSEDFDRLKRFLCLNS